MRAEIEVLWNRLVTRCFSGSHYRESTGVADIEFFLQGEGEESNMFSSGSGFVERVGTTGHDEHDDATTATNTKVRERRERRAVATVVNVVGASTANSHAPQGV